MQHPLDDFTYGQLNALVKKVGGKEGVEKLLAGELVVGKPGQVTQMKRTASRNVLAGLLKEVGEPFKCPAEKSFIVHQKFVVNVNGELPISGMGKNFIDNFLDLEESDVPAMTLRERELLERALDEPILAAHGDTLEKIERALVYLAHVFHFLKTADRSRWYVFYVADKNGTVWAVLARWNGVGWFFEAFSVRHPHEWNDGRRVVSPQILRKSKKK